MAPALKLSEAIRLGSMLGPQLDGELMDGSGGSCALGAAMLALGATNVMSGWDRMTELYLQHPAHTATCPACGASGIGLLASTIAHLNNGTNALFSGHGWTRERIADWVETLEQHQTIERLAQTLDAQEESCLSVVTVPGR